MYGMPHDVNIEIDNKRSKTENWIHQARPDRPFLEQWLGKIKEVIDGYRPDLLWFDYGVLFIQEHYKREFLTYYLNEAEKWGTDVVVTYKHHDLVPGSGLVDLELGRFSDLTYIDWITDTSVDDGNGWCYLNENTYKSPTEVVHYLSDNVSKNGYLLLNVDPKPNGLIPEPSIRTVWERLYPSEIDAIQMLGVDRKLTWRMQDDALRIKVPETRPCEHAYVFKVGRKPPFGRPAP